MSIMFPPRLVGSMMSAHAPATGLTTHEWSRGDVLALIGIAVAILVAVFSPIRKAIGRWWRAMLMRAGFPQLKYASWFVRQWGTYDNPYLDDRENLDLSNTY